MSEPPVEEERPGGISKTRNKMAHNEQSGLKTPAASKACAEDPSARKSNPRSLSKGSRGPLHFREPRDPFDVPSDIDTTQEWPPPSRRKGKEPRKLARNSNGSKFKLHEPEDSRQPKARNGKQVADPNRVPTNGNGNDGAGNLTIRADSADQSVAPASQSAMKASAETPSRWKLHDILYSHEGEKQSNGAKEASGNPVSPEVSPEAPDFDSAVDRLRHEYENSGEGMDGDVQMDDAPAVNGRVKGNEIGPRVLRGQSKDLNALRVKEPDMGLQLASQQLVPSNPKSGLELRSAEVLDEEYGLKSHSDNRVKGKRKLQPRTTGSRVDEPSKPNVFVSNGIPLNATSESDVNSRTPIEKTKALAPGEELQSKPWQGELSQGLPTTRVSATPRRGTITGFLPSRTQSKSSRKSSSRSTSNAIRDTPSRIEAPPESVERATPSAPRQSVFLEEDITQKPQSTTAKRPAKAKKVAAAKEAFSAKELPTKKKGTPARQTTPAPQSARNSFLADLWKITRESSEPSVHADTNQTVKSPAKANNKVKTPNKAEAKASSPPEANETAKTASTNGKRTKSVAKKSYPEIPPDEDSARHQSGRQRPQKAGQGKRGTAQDRGVEESSGKNKGPRIVPTKQGYEIIEDDEPLKTWQPDQTDGKTMSGHNEESHAEADMEFKPDDFNKDEHQLESRSTPETSQLALSEASLSRDVIQAESRNRLPSRSPAKAVATSPEVEEDASDSASEEESGNRDENEAHTSHGTIRHQTKQQESTLQRSEVRSNAEPSRGVDDTKELTSSDASSDDETESGRMTSRTSSESVAEPDKAESFPAAIQNVRQERSASLVSRSKSTSSAADSVSKASSESPSGSEWSSQKLPVHQLPSAKTKTPKYSSESSEEGSVEKQLQQETSQAFRQASQDSEVLASRNGKSEVLNKTWQPKYGLSFGDTLSLSDLRKQSFVSEPVQNASLINPKFKLPLKSKALARDMSSKQPGDTSESSDSESGDGGLDAIVSILWIRAQHLID